MQYIYSISRAIVVATAGSQDQLARTRRDPQDYEDSKAGKAAVVNLPSSRMRDVKDTSTPINDKSYNIGTQKRGELHARDSSGLIHLDQWVLHNPLCKISVDITSSVPGKNN